MFGLSQHKRARTRVVLISAHIHNTQTIGKKAIKHWGSVKRKRFNLSFFLCGRVSKKAAGAIAGTSFFVPIKTKRTEQEEEEEEAIAIAIAVATQLNFLLLLVV